jgi:hypothetical protein
MSQQQKNERLGSGAKNIFAKTEQVQQVLQVPQEQARQELPIKEAAREPEVSKTLSRGRPKEHADAWTKVTTVLFDRQIHWLDTLASTIRLNTRLALSRAEIIRGLISAVEESGIDLSQVSNEEDIKNILLKKLKHND